MKVAIQTVPARAAMAAVMMLRLPGDTKPYVDTTMRGSLWNMERILADSPDGVLILQDDVALPAWFMGQALESLIDGEVMSFFIGMSEEPRRLYDEGFSYARTQNVWGQANYYPPDFVAAYLEWAARQQPISPCGMDSPSPFRKWSGDDSSICACLRHLKRYAYLTLPNLVNHQEVPSVLGHPRTVRGIRRISSVFGESLLRPWDKTKIGKLKR